MLGVGVAAVSRSTLTKRFDLEHTRYAYQPRVQYPAVAVTVYPDVFYGPEGGALRDHDMTVQFAEGPRTVWARRLSLGLFTRIAGRC